MSSSVIIDDFLISAGGVLIDEKAKKVCLIHRNDTSEYLLPKGRKEPGETLAENAQREIFEETGYENKVSPENLIGIFFRPHVGGRPGQQKVIYWYYSVLVNEERHENTQEEGEDFTNEWLSFEEALKKVTFDDDRTLIKRAFKLSKIISDKEDDKEADWNWCGPDNKCIRLLTPETLEISRGFFAFKDGEILLSQDRVNQTWKLPTEKKDKELQAVTKSLSEQAAPSAFQLVKNGKELTVIGWYALQSVLDGVGGASYFNMERAIEKLKNVEHSKELLHTAFTVLGKL